MAADSSIPASAHISAATLLPPAIQAWEVYLVDQGRSLHTVKAFIGDVNLLTSFLPTDRAIGAITTKDLNQFIKWLETSRGVPCSPKSLARRITSIKAFFRWLHQYGVLLLDPADKVLQHSVTSPLPQVLNLAEQELLDDAITNHRLDRKKPDARPAALYLLLMTTGIKKGECMTLTLNHFDLNNPDGPLVFIRYASPQNRYKERKIPLTAEFMEVYQEYLGQYQPQERVFPWSQRRLEYLLEELSKETSLQKHFSLDMSL